MTIIMKSEYEKILVRGDDQTMVHTRLQSLFNLKFDNPLDRIVYQIIVVHAIAAERTSPGGFESCVQDVIQRLSGLPKNDHQEFSRDILVSGISVPDRSDLEWAVRRFGTMETAALLRQALDLAGLAGRIIVEKSASGVASVELVKGYTFELNPVWMTNVRFVQPRVICIDGYVENVSELHHLLQAISETRETCVLFVRGLADDVKQTLRVNFDRGTLKVFPVIVDFDLEGINTMNDLAVVAGTDVVSSLKGDLISSINLSDAVRVDQVDVNNKRIVVINRRNRASVKAHVNGLRKKRSAETLLDVARLIDRRIKSLLPNYVIIRLLDDNNFVVAAQSIDYALRAVKSLTEYGTTVVYDRRTLVATYAAAKIHSQRCFLELSSLGVVVRS